jgi:hypothetical protein
MTRAGARCGIRAWSRRLLIPVILGVGLGGCLPKARIEQFTARPFMACPGDPITLSWRTNGNVTLSAEPGPSELGKRDPSGRELVPLPEEATAFKVEVSRFFGLKKAHTEGVVETPPLTRSYIAEDAEGQTGFSCREQERAVEAFVDLNAENFSPGVFTEQVMNGNERPIVISKGGVSLPLEAGEASAFEGMPAQGRWALRVPLHEGEQCEDAIDDVAGRLVFWLQLSCRG